MPVDGRKPQAAALSSRIRFNKFGTVGAYEGCPGMTACAGIADSGEELVTARVNFAVTVFAKPIDDGWARRRFQARIASAIPVAAMVSADVSQAGVDGDMVAPRWP